MGFPPKVFSAKVFGGKNVRDFFSNLKIKKIFKILENIFWIFLKNNDFVHQKIRSYIFLYIIHLLILNFLILYLNILK